MSIPSHAMLTSAKLDPRITGPFPGLRAFEKYEAPIFFGRGIQVDDMIRRLEDHRFLAVVGSSGCGKSSLVRAGLLPALEDGELFTAGNDWLMVIAKPGATPFRNLAKSWIQTQASHSQNQGSDSGAAQKISLTEAVLHSGPLGLLELIEDSGIAANKNILLLIDQFEEIFRFRYQEKIAEGLVHEAASDEANAFVNLLLASARQASRQIYVLLTMRSDFLGDCNAFHGLPEAINDSQFLAPRMNQDQIRQAIVGPLKVFASSAEPALINRIIGDVGNDPDQLPLMQHVLMRMWTQQQKHSTWTNAEALSNPVTLTVNEYEQLGGVQEALSNHATEVLDELRHQGNERIVEMLFRSLRQRGDKGQEIRRPETIANIAAALEDEVDDPLIRKVIQVVEAFRKPKCSFLMPPPGVELTGETLVDISHESLIRRWKQMQTWAAHEDESAEILDYLVRSATAYERQTGDLLERKNLDRVNEWRTRFKPTLGWARRYVTEEDYQRASLFLRESRAADDARRVQEKQHEEKERQRVQQELETTRKLADAETARAQSEQKRSRILRRMMLGCVLGLVAISMVAFYAFLSWSRAEQATARAEQATADADKARRAAETATRKAEQETAAKVKALERLDQQVKALNKETDVRKEAEKNLRIALEDVQREAKQKQTALTEAQTAESRARRALRNAFEAQIFGLREVDTEAVPVVLERMKALSDSHGPTKDDPELELASLLSQQLAHETAKSETARLRLGLLVLSQDSQHLNPLLNDGLDPSVKPLDFMMLLELAGRFPDSLSIFRSYWEPLRKGLSSGITEAQAKYNTELRNFENQQQQYAAINKKYEEADSDENKAELDRSEKLLTQQQEKLELEQSRLHRAKERVFRTVIFLAKFDASSDNWKDQGLIKPLVQILTDQDFDEFEKWGWGLILAEVKDHLEHELNAVYKANRNQGQSERSTEAVARERNALELLKSLGIPPTVEEVVSDVKTDDLVQGMIWIQPGTDPTTNVKIHEGFYLGQTEITQQQYELVMGVNPAKFRGPQRPVENLSWQRAKDFCERLNKLETFPEELGLGKLPAGFEYRLPEVNQWEYAARAGKATPFSIAELRKMAIFEAEQTQPVGKPREPNDWGLFDMLGNVEEWCSDGTIENEFRGGSYFSGRSNVQPGKGGNSSFWGQTRGFRVAGVKKKP